MNIQEAAWLKRPYEDDKPYANCNVLGPSKNVSKRHPNYTTIFCIFLLALYALCWLF